jgi:diguanylate cyclase (GGDEF)-like protein
VRGSHGHRHGGHCRVIRPPAHRSAAGPIAITLSIGVTIANPNESTDALLARADDAMYQAKKLGRNQVVATVDSVVDDHVA